MLTFVQMLLIAGFSGAVIGLILGWKIGSSSKLAKIQEQQIKIAKMESEHEVEVDKLKDKQKKETGRLKEELSKAKSELRSIKFTQGKEKVGNAMSGTGKAITQFAGGVKKKFWSKKEEKDEPIRLMALAEENIQDDEAEES